MNDLFKYLLETFFCLMFFYIPFYLLMKKDTNFSLNRIYLIATLVLSYMIPLIEFKSKQMSVLTGYRDFIDGIAVYPSSSISIQSANFNIYDLLIYFYLAVCFVLLVRFMVNLLKIRSLIKEGKSNHLGSHNLVVIKEKIGTFSFFRSIFIDEETYNSKQVEHIIKHELSHVKEMHSIDLILIELLIIFSWFNPILRFYKRSIIENHEYQADSKVINTGIQPNLYYNILFDNLFPNNSLLNINKLNNSIIKSRYKMMKSIKSPAITKFKAVLVIPITLILIFIFSCSKSDDIIISENNRFKELSVQNDKLEKFAEFPGGPKIEYEFIKANFRTPAVIKEKGIAGKIHIGFIIEKDGSLSSVHIINVKHVGNSKYLKNFGYGCDEEALRVVKSMPKWTPAIKDGKPIASAGFIPIIIGDENRVFNEEDSSSTSYLYKGEKFDNLKEPVFGANQGDLVKFISDNIRYPENARLSNISGRVILSFDISPEGKTENIKVIQGIGGGCTEEAIRVVKLFPKWTPAFGDNKPIGVNRVLPIVFKLE